MNRVYLILSVNALILLSLSGCQPLEINYHEFNPLDLVDGVYEGYAENKNKAWVELHIENHKINDLIIVKLDSMIKAKQ